MTKTERRALLRDYVRAGDWLDAEAERRGVDVDSLVNIDEAARDAARHRAILRDQITENHDGVSVAPWVPPATEVGHA